MKHLAAPAILAAIVAAFYGGRHEGRRNQELKVQRKTVELMECKDNVQSLEHSISNKDVTIDACFRALKLYKKTEK